MQRRNQFVSWGVGLVAIAFIMTGCLKTKNTPPEPVTYIKVMHIASTAPSMDFYIGSEKLFTKAVDYGVASTYIPIKPNFYELTYKKAGGDSVIASVGTTRYDTSKPYTLLLYPTADNKAAAITIEDRAPENAGETKGYYRFWHLAQGVGAVDVYLGDKLLEQDRNLADNTFGTAFNRFTPVDASDNTLYVKEAGGTKVLAKLDNVSIQRYAGFTFFLKGKAGDTDREVSVGFTKNF